MAKLTITLATLLGLLVALATLSETSPVKCCTKLSESSLPLDRLKEYTMQDATRECRIKAVIFTTVKGRKMCANPNAQWVKQGIANIQRMKKAN